MLYPNLGAKFTQSMVARLVGTSRYCGRPTCFRTEAKDEPGPHFKNICDDGAVDAATLGG
jgi:hypothetical protein